MIEAVEERAFEKLQLQRCGSFPSVIPASIMANLQNRHCNTKTKSTTREHGAPKWV
jgi:hypothetical protein